MDPSRQKMDLLLARLENGLLDIDGAQELKPLLIQEQINARSKGDKEYEKDLLLLIDILDRYLKGEINLYKNIDFRVSV